MILSSTEESLQVARYLQALGILLRMGFCEQNPAITDSEMGDGGSDVEGGSISIGSRGSLSGVT